LALCRNSTTRKNPRSNRNSSGTARRRIEQCQSRVRSLQQGGLSPCYRTILYAFTRLRRGFIATCGSRRCSAFIIAIRAIIGSPPRSAIMIKSSVAVCHGAVCCYVVRRVAQGDERLAVRHRDRIEKISATNRRSARVMLCVGACGSNLEKVWPRNCRAPRPATAARVHPPRRLWLLIWRRGRRCQTVTLSSFRFRQTLAKPPSTSLPAR
jgi:hypothetical protein